MKLKIRDLFIGLEFKIEREVEIPEEILIKRIIQELRKLDYEVVDRTEKKSCSEKDGMAVHILPNNPIGIG
ncbi:hypothetical protein [Pedobacter sp. P26]|uniref:hypothetical protein n=1 Tax=Pedobacter sp. P26 TaxID=3423956 RepID=UPI003D67A91D